MEALAERYGESLASLARRRRVRRLALFGSAVTGSFDPARSDVDVVVEFEPLEPVERAEAFFLLLEDLEFLFGRPVDLVERAALRNPFLRRSVEATEVIVYDAA